jgi:hypothetical protein
MSQDYYDLLNDGLNNLSNENLNIKPESLQGGSDWHYDRLGKFTASRFDDLMKRGRGKDQRFGNMCLTYVYEVLGGILTQQPHIVTSQSMDWGHDNEQAAIEAYEHESGNKVDAVGFVSYGDYAGGSPDGLVGKDGIIEVKCPYNPGNHAKTLVTGQVPDQYWFQVQGNMMVTGRKWCDFISFDPRVQDESLKMKVIRVDRDEDTIELIGQRIKEVRELLEQIATESKINIESK